MIKQLLISLFMVFFLAGAALSQSAEEEIRNLLDERDEEIKELLGPKGQEYSQEQRDELKDIINDIIDYRAMAEFALGDTYHEISSEKRDQFVSVFSTIVRDHSLNRLEIYRAEYVYNDITVNNGEAKVRTTVQLDNVRTPVNYEMKMRDGEWMITDMDIDGVSTVASYNRQFQSIIRRRGFDALLQNLENRAAR